MNKARLSIGDYFVLFLKGRLVYAYGILPFSDADARKRTRRVSLDGEIKDTSHREWHYLKRRWSYYLGGALSTLLLFSVPFVELDTNFHYAMVIGLGVFVVPSLRNALLSFFLQGRKEKQDYIRSSSVFVCLPSLASSPLDFSSLAMPDLDRLAFFSFPVCFFRSVKRGEMASMREGRQGLSIPYSSLLLGRWEG